MFHRNSLTARKYPRPRYAETPGDYRSPVPPSKMESATEEEARSVRVCAWVPLTTNARQRAAALWGTDPSTHRGAENGGEGAARQSARLALPEEPNGSF